MRQLKIGRDAMTKRRVKHQYNHDSTTKAIAPSLSATEQATPVESLNSRVREAALESIAILSGIRAYDD